MTLFSMVSAACLMLGMGKTSFQKDACSAGGTGACSGSAHAKLPVRGAGVVVGLDIIDHFVCRGKGQADVAVGAAVVEGDVAGGCILQGGAGEADIGHKAPFF